MKSSMITKYYMPTRVIAGRNCVKQHAELLKTYGRKALLVTGARSAKMNGSQDDMVAALEAAGIEYAVFDKVMANPTVDCVYEGAASAREHQADFIVALGGGSPMDAAKAIALLAAQDIAEENLFLNPIAGNVLPTVFVPTTAGTGSEVTPYAVLTNDKAQTKMSIAADVLFPAVAFLDARYMESLTRETMVNTVIDALSHAVEGMLSVRASWLSDTLALASMRLIAAILNSGKLGASGTGIDPEDSEQLLQASCLAGMVIAQTGTTVVHSMGYSLTYFKAVDHGRANGLLLGEYLRLVEQSRPQLTAKILAAMNLSGVDAFQDLMDAYLGAREKLTQDEIDRFSKLAAVAKNVSNGVVRTTEEDIRRLFQKSLI